MEPVIVWEAANLMEAEIVKGRLEAEGIPALIRGDAAGTIFGLTAGELAKADVLVPAALAERAAEILAVVVIEPEVEDDAQPDDDSDSAPAPGAGDN